MGYYFCTEIKHNGIGAHFISTREYVAFVNNKCTEEESTNMPQLLNSHYKYVFKTIYLYTLLSFSENQLLNPKARDFKKVLLVCLYLSDKESTLG